MPNHDEARCVCVRACVQMCACGVCACGCVRGDVGVFVWVCVCGMCVCACMCAPVRVFMYLPVRSCMQVRTGHHVCRCMHASTEPSVDPPGSMPCNLMFKWLHLMYPSMPGRTEEEALAQCKRAIELAKHVLHFSPMVQRLLQLQAETDKPLGTHEVGMP